MRGEWLRGESAGRNSKGCSWGGLLCPGPPSGVKGRRWTAPLVLRDWGHQEVTVLSLPLQLALCTSTSGFHAFDQKNGSGTKIQFGNLRSLRSRSHPPSLKKNPEPPKVPLVRPQPSPSSVSIPGTRPQEARVSVSLSLCQVLRSGDLCLSCFIPKRPEPDILVMGT